MRVCVALEHRFRQLPDGSVWTQSQFGYAFWQRYLDVFDEVRCLARVLDVERLDGEWYRADGRAVSFWPLPHYVGLGQFLWRARRIHGRIQRAVAAPGDAFVLRVPGAVGTLAWRRLNALAYPYAVEVIGDPYDAFSPGAIQLPLRGILRWQATRHLKMQCAGARAASYVTDHALQRRYPTPSPAIAASTVELPDTAFARRPRTFEGGAARLVFVGLLGHKYKGADVLIEAFARCVRRGLDLHLTIVGDGRHRRELEVLSATTGCADRVHFAGQLASGDQVRAQLDRADLFVLPSRQEGLPRAMLEAMARGLPCIGSSVGGIPELLPPNAVVPAGSVGALAGCITATLSNPAAMNGMAARNLERAKAYRSSVLQQRRVGFYRLVREVTEAWMQAPPQDGGGV